jgi:hypothetical protein
MTRRAVLPVVLLAALVAGCGPTQGDIEKSIRDEMKAKTGTIITSFSLTKNADGSFVGTATAQNGDVYDVSTKPPVGGKMEWKCIPGQAMVERVVTQGIQQQLSLTITSFQLTKSGPGIYSGTAVATTGAKVSVSTHMEGAQLMWTAQPAVN